MSLYQDKNRDYFSTARWDLLKHIPEGTDTVLEIGAGSGDSLIALKESGIAKHCFGIELFKLPNTQQNRSEIERFIIGNIETMNIDFPIDYFDVIILGDVLEHLIDPWIVVKKILPFLKKGGIIIASCPNARDITILGKILLTGRFKYELSGSLDRTHLRFFCKKDLVDMFSIDGLTVKNALPNYTLTPKRKLFSRFHFGLLDEIFSPQNIVIAQKV